LKHEYFKNLHYMLQPYEQTAVLRLSRDTDLQIKEAQLFLLLLVEQLAKERRSTSKTSYEAQHFKYPEKFIQFTSAAKRKL